MRKSIDEKVEWWESPFMKKSIDEKVDWWEMNLDDSWWIFEMILGYGHGLMHRWTLLFVKSLSRLKRKKSKS